LRRAEALGVRLIEADVHLFARRLEVRHLKTLGPVPILWDRWELAAPWAPRLLLHQLLAAARGPELMLDLKGRDPRLPRLVAEAIAAHGQSRPVTVCSQRWDLLEPLRGTPGIRVVHSVGNARQLDALRRCHTPTRLAGVSIHRELLDARVTRELRDRAELLMSWPVDTGDQAGTLASWGVHGLISSRFEALAPFLAATASAQVAA
jgi:hypothetical protein